MYAVDVRLRAFGDTARWALVVDTVGYSPRAANLDDTVHTFGNCLTDGEPEAAKPRFHRRIDNVPDVFVEMERTDTPTVAVVIRGNAIDLPVEEERWSMFRRLVPEHRDLLLADDAEARERLPGDLPMLLRLDEWHQPDLYETPPSGSETYRLVAAVLETLDPGTYQSTLPPNTHWSNWPWSGML